MMMVARARRIGALFVFCMLFAACATPATRMTGAFVQPRKATISDVPFFPQEDNQCGPTALAELLRWSGVADVTPASLTPTLYLPAREGTLQIEMIAQTRQHQRLPMVLQRSWNAVAAEVASGRPVVVLLNLGLGIAPIWHYAVIIGYDEEAETVSMHSGRQRALQVPWSRFDRAWTKAGEWAMVVSLPSEIPVSATSDAWLQVGFSAEQADKLDLASVAYDAGTKRWPLISAFALAAANIQYREGDLSGAEKILRMQLTRQPDDGMLQNNLAQLLLEQGRAQEAYAWAIKAAAHHDQFQSVYQDTLLAAQQALAKKTH